MSSQDDAEDKDEQKAIDALINIDEVAPELTERQQRVLKYTLRGLSQRAIASIEKVSQPMIAKEMKEIKKVFAAQGRNIDQGYVVGETTHLYQEIEQRAWELYHKASTSDQIGDANRALATIMTARDKSLKLMMDLGLIKRAAVEHTHSLKEPPFLQKWKETNQDAREHIVQGVIEAQLVPLAAPTPPILEAEIDLPDLEEPVPPEEEDND